MPFMFDSTFLMLIPAIILSIYAQFKVRSTYKKYREVANQAGITGAEVARQILRSNGLDDVAVEEVPGTLSDHYDPRDKTVRLSTDNFRGRSIAALSIAAHEVGHAIQDAKDYAPLRMRHAILPVANIGSSLSMWLILAGFFFQFSGLFTAGILFFSGAVLFQLVTLPVEFNASSRALEQLDGYRYLHRDEMPFARKVLNAAALTYVAAAAVSVLELVRLLILRNSMSDD
ncbi:MAG: zinc metallopeptidase [Calditrichia bacterium]|nr:zinc metallopeptidase [Calditrichota bacterium]MCB0269815.1 zinc metallopeptidase [Calditrichota bacterium]MCB0285119.1 zinc metallopeptidase [Calditrichota bacterium]MCB9066804.1 zinc metallopeptidase [Calditrichia bacterium]